MTTARQRCQCTATCTMVADEGHPFCLSHDKRPERQEERRQMLAERGRVGGEKFAANMQAARDELAENVTLRTIDGQLQTLDTLLRNLMRSRLDAAKIAQAGGQLVKIAREVIAAAELEAENRDLRQLIAERHPELARHLKVAK